MYLMAPGNPFNDRVASSGVEAANNLVGSFYNPLLQKANVQQQQNTAEFAPQTSMANLAETYARANMFGGRNDYYQAGAGLDTTKSGVLQSGGNNPLAQFQRIRQASMITGDIKTAQEADIASNNYLREQQSKIGEQNAMAQQAQAGSAFKSAGAVNEGSPSPYISAQLPGQAPMGAPMNGSMPQGGMPYQGMGVLQNTMQTEPTTGQPIYANTMNDTDLIGSAMKGQLPPLQPMAPGGGVALKAQSINAQKQMDSMQTYPSKLQAMSDFYNNSPTQKYVGPELSLAGAARGIGNVMNAVGAAQNSYNQYQSGHTNALLAGEGLSQLAVPGTRSGTLISKNIAQLSPDQVKNPDAANGQIQEIAKANLQDLTGYIKGHYLPSVRQSAIAQLQSNLKYPVYQKAYAQMQQDQTAAQPGAAAASTIVPGVPDAQAMAYAKAQGWVK